MRDGTKARTRNNGTRAGDDYNFSVSITVAARLAAIFQQPKVHAAPSRLLSRNIVSIACSSIRGNDLCEKKGKRS